MSRQVRDLVERSVFHFAEYFSYYSVSNLPNLLPSKGVVFLSCSLLTEAGQLEVLNFKSQLFHFLLGTYFFQEGNNFGKEYKDYIFIKRPLLRIKVVGQPGSTAITFDPSLDHMRVLIIKWLHAIIGVNHQLPSVDAIMYPGLCSI